MLTIHIHSHLPHESCPPLPPIHSSSARCFLSRSPTIFAGCTYRIGLCTTRIYPRSHLPACASAAPPLYSCHIICIMYEVRLDSLVYIIHTTSLRRQPEYEWHTNQRNYIIIEFSLGSFNLIDWVFVVDGPPTIYILLKIQQPDDRSLLLCCR